MPGAVYEKVKAAVLEKDSFIKQGEECIGKKASSTDQKIVAAILESSHGFAASFLNTEFQLLESLIHLCRERFVATVAMNF